jgi:nitroimidazol reductase NimA-like FMN-containing flavoprotein (pyridoxamine 5'-phosphate oxidase superfamily)
MNRPIRRKERQMPAASAQELLTRAEYGILSTVAADGQPYGVPVSYTYDGVDAIYFHGALVGHKLDNLHHDPRVCFTVVGYTQVLPNQFSTVYESAIAFGLADVLDGDEKRLGLRLLAAKYNPGDPSAAEEYIERAFSATQVVRIHIEQLTGKHRN